MPCSFAEKDLGGGYRRRYRRNCRRVSRIFYFRADISAKYDFMPITLSFFIIGIFGSVLTEIGDLFESYIKRKVGIKDMGRIMPGHGGVMDRIDGMSFAAVFIYFWFLIFIG